MDERDILRESFERILRNDKELAGRLEELKGLARHEDLKPTVRSVQERVGTLETLGDDQALALETIVNRVGRPVLEVAGDDYVIEGAEAAIWETRLSDAATRSALRTVIPSVGRIEVDHHPGLTWVGTGWLIADDIVVTNRHVASEFAALSVTDAGRSFVFKRGWPDRDVRMAARVDFRRELRDSGPRAFRALDVLHIEDDDGPDFAFLKIERTSASGSLTAPLRPAGQAVQANDFIAVIGYPASDSRIPEQELMSRLFGDKYNVKRLAPGQVMSLTDDLVRHDCSTLGGNSGSPIVNLTKGEVLGLHFSGVFLRENRAVPIGYVTSRLDKVARGVRPKSEVRPDPVAPAPPPPASPPFPPSPPPSSSSSAGVTAGPSVGWTEVGATGTSATFVIPLRISIALGAAEPVALGLAFASAPPPTSSPAVVPDPNSIRAAVQQARERIKTSGQADARSNVLAVREGFAFRDGWITSQPAVVIVHQATGSPSASDFGLPSMLGTFPVEVRPAGPWDLAEARTDREALEGVPRIAYVKPRDFALKDVDEEMTVICHASPDAGWPVLSEFLRQTKTGLTVGIYDFTAPHIIDGVLSAVRGASRKLALVMQRGEALAGKPDDLAEEITIQRCRNELGERFEYAPASVGSNRQFASAYHIKVAVRDSQAFWLSSGNLQSSNQPDHGVAAGETSWDLLRDHNREWHAVVENAELARQFEAFLRYDLENARADFARAGASLDAAASPDRGPFFIVDETTAAAEERAPSGQPTYFSPLTIKRRVRVAPLLTPDNYQERVLQLIDSARRSILFQNQSLSPLEEDDNDPRFVQLLDALLAKQRAGVGLRIIIRGEFAPIRPLERLQRRGFDMSKVRLQNRCHTKGIIVDSARVLVGSHNWTNQGTLVNRDASLIFDDEEIAQYFERMFQFDWEHLSRQSVRPQRARPAPLPTPGSGQDAVRVESGQRIVSWREIVNGG